MFVIWSLGLGGAEQVVIRLAAGLDRRRFTPVICCLNEPGPFASQAASHGIEVIALRKRPGVDLAMLWRLTRLMRARRIRIVHPHLWGANCWGRLAAYLSRVPVILAHEHGLQPWRGRWHFLCDRWLGRVTHRVLFASHDVMESYSRRTGIPAARCQVIPNGVETAPLPQRREALRQAHGWAAEERVIVSVGRHVPEKGYEDLLTATASLAKQLPRVRVVLIGDGPDRARLEALKAQLGVNGHVVFAGRLPQEQVAQWVAAADVYVQPSRAEALPLAVLEAMAAGVPVIATRVGDLQRLIADGRTGHLVPPADPGALAATIRDVLQHPDRERAIAEAAQAMVRQRHSHAGMMRAVEQVYDDAIRARPA